MACRWGRPRVVKILIDQKADIDSKNSDGESPWDVVWNLRQTDTSTDAAECLAHLLEAGFNPPMPKARNGSSFLHLVAFRFEADRLIKILVEKHGADVNAVDANGWTPLHYAAFDSNYYSCKGLIESGSDINAQSTKTVKKERQDESNNNYDVYRYEAGSTPLDLENQTGTRTAKNVRKLLEDHGAKSNNKVNNLWTHAGPRYLVEAIGHWTLLSL